MTPAWREATADERAGWDRALAAFPDGHVRQSAGWAELKSGGWKPLFLVLPGAAGPRALALCLTRRIPLGPAVIWVNGGPALGETPLGDAAAGLAAEAARRFGRAYVRLNLPGEAEPEAEAALAGAGFRPARVRLDSGLTVTVDLTPSAEVLRANLDRKWRNQLKTAEKAAPDYEAGAAPEILARYAAMHNANCRRKGLSSQVLGEGELERMARALGPGFTLLLASVGGELGAGMTLWRLGARAVVGHTASTELGRSKCLANALYWKAMLTLKAEGARELDTAGVDPEKAWGVYNFKRGLGGREVRCLGEWEWATGPLSAAAASAAVWLRRRGAA